ncbi:MAG TPA: MotA/TolQ/ExbB proton channel family protein [Gammaproteobacteria bacterium]|nr:MotA/TolQ/ExbB proton channel family protein [Gammaproteobacteria bacterium]
MWPILLCSILATAIVFERLWTLHGNKVAPEDLLSQVQRLISENTLDDYRLLVIRNSSPLGQILAVGLDNRHKHRMVVKEAIEEAGRHVVHELERYLNTLGTIATITPLLGLLGTVFGMIKIFAAITPRGISDPTILANGISVALITTAAGLTIGIPSLAFYRYLRGRVSELTVTMEQEAMKLVELMQNERNSSA